MQDERACAYVNLLGEWADVWQDEHLDHLRPQFLQTKNILSVEKQFIYIYKPYVVRVLLYGEEKFSKLFWTKMRQLYLE